MFRVTTPISLPTWFSIGAPVPHHGFGTINDPGRELDWSGKNKLKLGVAGTAELGFLFTLGEDTDLLLGGYIDYGLHQHEEKERPGVINHSCILSSGWEHDGRKGYSL